MGVIVIPLIDLIELTNLIRSFGGGFVNNINGEHDITPFKLLGNSKLGFLVNVPRVSPPP